MKKYLCIAVNLLLIAVMTACVGGLTGNPTANEVAAQAVYDASDEAGETEYADEHLGVRSHWQGLRMDVQAGSVTPTGLRLTMINNSELSFGHGTPFRIEQNSSAGWHEVPTTGIVVWTMPLLHVKAYTTVDEDISWEHIYGELPPGQYRIVSNFIEHDLFDPTPMWQQDIPDAYLYAVFTVTDGWQAAYDIWQNEQDELAAIAYARFKGLDLEILEYSARGLSFTLTNNNSDYSYIITGAFVGWEDILPEGGSAGAVEYFIFSQGFDISSWPFGEDKRLHSGESIFLEVDWYDEIGNLPTGKMRRLQNNCIFDLTVDVMLDVDEEYIAQNFRHIMPRQLRLPSVGHRIQANFDISYSP